MNTKGGAAKLPLILAIDQGTTSSRAIAFDADGVARASAQREFAQHYPQDGWVEHDAEQIWQTTLDTCREVLTHAVAHGTIEAIGIANQRETTVVWRRSDGRPIYNAIVWQDRRTADFCRQLADDHTIAQRITAKTGLLVDSYFSAPKIKWILDNVEGARKQAESGELAFGTIDTFLIWRLTGGRAHVTDATNASRTLLYDISAHRWDDDLLSLFTVPVNMLPQVLDCAAEYGECSTEHFGKPLPIRGVAGDQQAALFGQACFTAGMVKSTFGTGCFVMMNSGDRPPQSQHRLLGTIGYRLGGKTTYALEGAIFNAGTAVQWLRDIGVIDDTAEIDRLIMDTAATAADPLGNGGVYLVPAFTGLGAPHWDADARAALVGLTRDSGKAQLVRAALEAVCHQTRDLLDAMRLDAMRGDGGDGHGNIDIRVVRVDGGMVVNDWLMQFLADLLDVRVDRPAVIETTALGAAYLAALQIGWFADTDEIAASLREYRRFESRADEKQNAARRAGWQDALRRVRSG